MTMNVQVPSRQEVLSWDVNQVGDLVRGHKLLDCVDCVYQRRIDGQKLLTLKEGDVLYFLEIHSERSRRKLWNLINKIMETKSNIQNVMRNFEQANGGNQFDDEDISESVDDFSNYSNEPSDDDSFADDSEDNYDVPDPEILDKPAKVSLERRETIKDKLRKMLEPEDEDGPDDIYDVPDEASGAPDDDDDMYLTPENSGGGTVIRSTLKREQSCGSYVVPQVETQISSSDSDNYEEPDEPEEPVDYVVPGRAQTPNTPKKTFRSSLPDPKPSDMRPSGPKPSDMRPSGPKPSDMRPSGPKPSDFRLSGPKPSDSRWSGPKPPESRPPGPKPPESRAPGPKPPESRPPGPKPPESRPLVGPRLSGPKPSDVRTSDQGTSNQRNPGPTLPGSRYPNQRLPSPRLPNSKMLNSAPKFSTAVQAEAEMNVPPRPPRLDKMPKGSINQPTRPDKSFSKQPILGAPSERPSLVRQPNAPPLPSKPPVLPHDGKKRPLPPPSATSLDNDDEYELPDTNRAPAASPPVEQESYEPPTPPSKPRKPASLPFEQENYEPPTPPSKPRKPAPPQVEQESYEPPTLPSKPPRQAATIEPDDEDYEFPELTRTQGPAVDKSLKTTEFTEKDYEMPDVSENASKATKEPKHSQSKFFHRSKTDKNEVKKAEKMPTSPERKLEKKRHSIMGDIKQGIHKHFAHNTDNKTPVTHQNSDEKKTPPHAQRQNNASPLPGRQLPSPAKRVGKLPDIPDGGPDNTSRTTDQPLPPRKQPSSPPILPKARNGKPLPTPPKKDPPKPQSKGLSLLEQPWFHAAIEKSVCTDLVRDANQDGAFLVRNSSKGPDSYVMTISYQSEIRHLTVPQENGKYRLGASGKMRFDSVIEIVEHFKKNEIEFGRGGRTRLTHACLKYS